MDAEDDAAGSSTTEVRDGDEERDSDSGRARQVISTSWDEASHRPRHSLPSNPILRAQRHAMPCHVRRLAHPETTDADHPSGQQSSVGFPKRTPSAESRAVRDVSLRRGAAVGVQPLALIDGRK